MNALDALPEILTISEVAKYLRVHKVTLARWDKSGKLPAMRINSRGDRRYKKSDILKLVGTN